METKTLHSVEVGDFVYRYATRFQEPRLEKVVDVSDRLIETDFGSRIWKSTACVMGDPSYPAEYTVASQEMIRECEEREIKNKLLKRIREMLDLKCSVKVLKKIEDMVENEIKNKR